MPLLKHINRSYLCTIIVLVFNSLAGIAQQIKLKDIAKIEFLYRAGGMSSDGRLIEVIPENNTWNSYQTRLVEGWNFKKKMQINDSSRTFIRNISPKNLEQLLSLIAKPDTGINPALFGIHKDELIKYIDTVVPHLKPLQRAEFARALQQDSTINKMLIKVNTPFMMDDRSYYGITITTRANKTFKIYALSFASSYYMPWIINKRKSYNPHLAEIFNYVGGDEWYAADEKQRLYKRIILFTNLTYFSTRFSWDDLKEEEPTLFTALKKSLVPVSFVRYDKGGSGTFLSSRLPAYVQLKIGFSKGDIAAIELYNRQEDSLTNVFKKSNFLFNYVKKKPGCIIYISPDEMVDHGKYTLRDIKKYYPEIDGVDYKQIYLLTVVENKEARMPDQKKSKWLLLPNDKVILIYYSGKLKIGHNGKFKDIAQNKRLSNTACFVFDSMGKKIGGIDGPVDIYHYYSD